MYLNDTELICIAVAFGLNQKKPKQNKRRRWMKEWYKQRAQYSHEKLLNCLRMTEPDDYRNFLRMDATSYENLLKLVTPHIQKQNTIMREAISVNERLSITLRYLATGNTFEDLTFLSAISPQSISSIVLETCQAIITSLKTYIKIPKTEAEEWVQIAKDFEQKWNFPHCVGALDGKHVEIRKPPNSGSFYFKYKNTFSIVLMAVVDADYKFMMVDVGINGRISDGGVISYTKFGNMLNNKTLNIPKPDLLTNTNYTLPYLFVADDAFAMSENLLKPYSQTNLTKEQRIFNYRLSRARRIVENAFGILNSRFGVFQRPIQVDTDKAKKIVLACCFLHNYLRKSASYICQGSMDMEYEEEGRIIEGSWRTQEPLINLQHGNNRNSTELAKDIRNTYCQYFNNEGKIPWQDKFIV